MKQKQADRTLSMVQMNSSNVHLIFKLWNTQLIILNYLRTILIYDFFLNLQKITSHLHNISNRCQMPFGMASLQSNLTVNSERRQ